MSATDPLSAQAASARTSRTSINDEVNAVNIYFDWQPSVTEGCIIFQARVIRGEERSTLAFSIDLTRLSRAELEQLHSFLSRRHAGLTSGYEVTRFIIWLLSISLRQQQPELTDQERDREVRELLLSRSRVK